MNQGVGQRLVAIDALRGLVMLLMLLDHVRETFFLHYQVSDPMAVATTGGLLFFSRSLAHLCAPVFIFLTGLSAALYWQKTGSLSRTRRFLLQRGLFLVVLELTLVNFAWTFQFPPTVIYLQVIWAIGLSMIALALLVSLPRVTLLIIGVVLVAGHNLLDAVHTPPGSGWSIPWAILHDRGWITVIDGVRLRTSYPLLPWIGVIALGFVVGTGYRALTAQQRIRRFTAAGFGLLALFLVLRAVNGYGEKPWQASTSAAETVMAFFNITKYPPSLLFLLLTLGIGLLLLAAFERGSTRSPVNALAHFGAAPMFFYLLHLYVLKALYLLALAIWGPNYGDGFGVGQMWQIWLITLALGGALFYPVCWFADLKARHRDWRWLKYF